MAALRWYLSNQVTVDGGGGSGWQALSDTAQTAATTGRAWIVGTGATFSSEFASALGSDRPATSFVANTVPDGTLDTTLKDACRTGVLSGAFASGNWTVQFAVVSPVQAGAADGQIVFRLIKADADGSNATLITAAQQAASVCTNVLASPDANGTLTFNPGAFTITEQHLFVQMAWKRTGAGGMTTTSIMLRTGVSATVGTTILSSDFTAAIVRVGTLAQTLGDATCAAEAIVPAQGLVAYWALNEQDVTSPALDAHGSNPLTPVNDPGWTTGKSGTSRYFETSYQRYFWRTSNADLQPDGPFSLSCWIYLYTPGTMVIVSKDVAGGREFTLDLVSGSLRFYVNGGTGGILDRPGVLSVSTWYHITCGYYSAAGGSLWLEVNAVPDAEVTGVAPPVPGNAQFQIGAREYVGAQGYFDGRIDEVGFWTRVLTDGEITWLYNAGAGRSYAEINQKIVVSTGTLTQTLGDATVLAPATVEARAVLARTLEAATVTAPATVEGHATVTRTLAAATVVAATTTDQRAVLTQTLATATVLAPATVEARAVLTQTLASATVAATGLHGRDGVLAQTLAAATVEATGTVVALPTRDAVLAQTLAAATATTTATAEARATLTRTLALATVLAPATVEGSGTLTQTLAGATLTASGSVAALPARTADVVQTLAAATVTASAVVIGLPVRTADLVQTLDAATVTATATAPAAISGGLTQTLVSATLSATIVTTSRSAVLAQMCEPAVLAARVTTGGVVPTRPPTGQPFMWLT